MGSNVIQVGMADIQLAKAPDKLMSAGLGSCIGICVYDPAVKTGVLAHIMLPQMTQLKNMTSSRAKFADTAVEMILEIMAKNGINRSHLQAKIAGGAQMFKFSGENDAMKIGDRNSQAVQEHLRKHNIKLLAKDVGGNHGRTIIFDPANGDLLVRTLGHGERVI